MNKKEITTACGLALVSLNSLPTDATTGTNEKVSQCLYSASMPNGEMLEKPSNLFSVEKQIETLTVSDIIRKAEKSLGLSKQHLARVFATTRQNLHNLLTNPEQKPNQKTENRANQVNEALTIIRSICPYKIGASALTVRVDDKRLFDILIEEKINLSQVIFFSEIIANRLNKKSQSKLPEQIIEQEAFLSRPNAV